MNAKQITNSLNSIDFNSDQSNSQLKILLSEIDKRIDELTTKREKILFPKRNSDLESFKTIGLLEENNALSFLASPQTLKSIIQKIMRDLELSRIDSVSILFDKVVSTIPVNESEWIDLHRINPEKYQLLKELKGIYNIFCDRYGIDVIDKELSTLKKIQSNINQQIKEEIQWT